jgi:hypothetical protein
MRQGSRFRANEIVMPAHITTILTNHPDFVALSMVVWGAWNAPYLVYGLWFVVCNLWFVICGLWFVESLIRNDVSLTHQCPLPRTLDRGCDLHQIFVN